MTIYKQLQSSPGEEIVPAAAEDSVSLATASEVAESEVTQRPYSEK